MATPSVPALSVEELATLEMLSRICIGCEQDISEGSELFSGREVATLNTDCVAPTGSHAFLCRNCVAEYKTWDASQP